MNAIVASDTTHGAGRPLLEREILDPVAPILKLGGLGDQFQVSDAAPYVYSELVGKRVCPWSEVWRGWVNP